jgi:hypothetical protein
LNPAASEIGRPVIEGRNPELVPINRQVSYRIPLVGNARRIPAGSRLQILLTSDDQPKRLPSMLGFRHATVGTSSLNRIASSSRLVIPTMPSGIG